MTWEPRRPSPCSRTCTAPSMGHYGDTWMRTGWPVPRRPGLAPLRPHRRLPPDQPDRGRPRARAPGSRSPPARDRLGALAAPWGRTPLHGGPVPDGVRVRAPRARRRRVADGAAHGRDPGDRFALLPRSRREGPPDARRRGLPGPGGSAAGSGQVVPYQDHSDAFIARSPTACARSPGCSSTSSFRASRR